MTIIFITGSMEPGRDGVGDYVRLLAREVISRGHSCAVIALNDIHLGESVHEVQDGLDVMRLSSVSSWESRLERVRVYVADKSPDWISIQFVAYAFNRKGIVAGLGKKLASIAMGAHVHLMFHELWIGEGGRAPLRHRIVGAMQKFFIQDMLRHVSPAVVHTQTPAYRMMLDRCGISADLLPLFGNIVPGRNFHEGKLWSLLQAKVHGGPKSRHDYWIVGLFGTIHSEWQPAALLNVLDEAARAAGKNVLLLAFGRLGASEAKWEDLKANYSGKSEFLRLGELNPEDVSQVIRDLDFAIGTSPWQLVPKSGTIAAFLEHGVPVVIPRDDYTIPDLPNTEEPYDPFLHRFDEDLPLKLGSLQKRPPKSNLPDVAEKLIRDLSRVSPAGR